MPTSWTCDIATLTALNDALIAQRRLGTDQTPHPPTLSCDTVFGNVTACNTAVDNTCIGRAIHLRASLAAAGCGNCDILTSAALTVSNLNEAFMWGVDFLIAEEHRPRQTRPLAQRIIEWTQSKFTMSSAYSRIGTPETSNGM